MSTMSSTIPTPLVIQGTSSIAETSQHPFIESTIPNSQQTFPVRTFKIFGGIQIGLGIILGILSIIGVVLDSIAKQKYDDCYDPYGFNYDNWWRCHRYKNSTTVFVFDVTCLLCAAWYILTGFLPLCMSRKRISSWRCLKIAFMVCCIVGASVFVPTMFSLGVVGAILRGNYDSHVVVLSVFISILSLAEMTMAIIAAAYCCCCSPSGAVNQPVNVVYLNAAQPGIVMNLPQTQIPMVTAQNMMTSTAQYPRAQQYQVVGGINQTNANLVSSNQSQAVSTNPPPYKE